MLDLDYFKQINDTYGHDVGDEVLMAVARRLQSCIRQYDIAGRMGGDEFCLLLDGVTSQADVTAIVKQLLRVVAQPLKLKDRVLTISTSIGFVLSNGREEDENTLMKAADIALYHAKYQGRNTYQIYDPTLTMQVIKEKKQA